MCGRMGRSETRTVGAIIYNEKEARSYLGILAGPHSPDDFLDHLAAEQVRNGSGKHHSQSPPNTFPAKILYNKNQQEKVKGHPERSFPEIRNEGIEPFMLHPMIYT